MNRVLVQSVTAGVAFIIFLALNFTVAKPLEVCLGSDNCVVNCVPTGGNLVGMCCEEHCSPRAPTATCYQTYTANGAGPTTCTCLESSNCQYVANQAFSNLGIAFLLVGLMMTYFAALNHSKASPNFHLPKDDTGDEVGKRAVV